MPAICSRSRNRIRGATNAITFNPFCSQNRQCHREGGALAGARALGLDGAAVQFDQRFDEGQADAEPAMRTVERLIDLGKHLEDVCQHGLRNACTVVGDRNRGALGSATLFPAGYVVRAERMTESR